MNVALHRLRQIALVLVFIIAAVWLWSEGGQWLLRWRAQRLLTDVRALNPGQSNWSDAQHVMAAWSHFGTANGSCTPEFCKYEIDLVQALPPILTGSPEPGANHWIADAAIFLGIRAAAVRAGFDFHHGVLTSKWFGEQVTVPLRDWNRSQNYVPYLSVSARESSLSGVSASKPLDPIRLIHHQGLQLDISFAAQESEANRSAFYDFRLNCITRFKPCETPADILPEGWSILQRK